VLNFGLTMVTSIQTTTVTIKIRSVEFIAVFSRQRKGKKVKADIALNDTPSQNYGTSLAIWQQTVLPATRHK